MSEEAPEPSLAQLKKQLDEQGTRLARIESAVLSMVATPGAGSGGFGRWHAIALALGGLAGSALEKALNHLLGG